MIIGWALGLLSVLIASFSQVLLKKAAQKQQNNFIKKFLNVWVICGYILLFGSLFINTFVLRKLELKFLPCITATSFFWVLLFSRIFLGERPSKNKIIGIIIDFYRGNCMPVLIFKPRLKCTGKVILLKILKFKGGFTL